MKFLSEFFFSFRVCVCRTIFQGHIIGRPNLTDERTISVRLDTASLWTEHAKAESQNISHAKIAFRKQTSSDFKDILTEN